MRRMTALLLALMLLAVPAFAQEAPADAEQADTEEDAARVAVNLQAIKVMLDASELTFTYQEESDTFALRYTLECEMGKAILWITAYDDGVWLRADYEEDVPEDKWDEFLRFCSLCNEEGRLGCFYLDRENRSVGYKQFLYTDVLPPTQASLTMNTALALGMLEYRGNGTAAILFQDATAEEAIKLE